MPQDKLPFIAGIKDPKELARFKNILRAVGVPENVKQIYVGTPSELQRAQNVFGIMGGTHAHPAFSLYNVGRIYLPQEAIGNDDLIDKYLLHEFGHFAGGAYNKNGGQSDLTNEQSMVLEAAANKAAQPFRARFKLYNSPQGQAYRALQSQSAKLPGEFEPSRAPLGTQLTPPQSPVTPNSTPTPAPSSQPNRLLSLETLGQHIPAAILGALGHAARKV